MWNIIVRGKNGEQNFIRYDLNTSTATVVKREQFSREMSKILLDKDDPIDQARWSIFPKDPIEEDEEEFRQAEEEQILVRDLMPKRNGQRVNAVEDYQI